MQENTDYKMNMHALRMELRADLEADKANILGANYPDDELHEYVDARIPIYHGRLVELLYSDVELGYGPEDSGLVKEAPTVWDILTAAVYERLSAEAAEWLEEARAEQELDDEITAAVASMEPISCD